MAEAASGLRSRFDSFFSSRFCSLFPWLVIFSAGVVDGVEAAAGEDVDAAFGVIQRPGVGEGVGL